MKRQPRIGMIGVMFEEYHASYPELEKSQAEFSKVLVDVWHQWQSGSRELLIPLIKLESRFV